MFVKIAGIVLSGVIVVGGIFGISQLDRSYKGYDATDLLNGLEEVYNEEFMICDENSSGGCIDHYHNFYTVCSKEDKSSRFSFESISDAGKKDKLMLSDNILPCYGVSKACNVINGDMEEKLDVIGIIPEDISMLFGTKFNVEDLKKGIYLSSPISFLNSVKNAEYVATYFYPFEYDKDAALREVVTNINNLDVNECKITIAFVTDEEYKMFKEQNDNFEYVYVRDDQYGISARNCVFLLEKTEDTIGLRNAETYEKIDISKWIYETEDFKTFIDEIQQKDDNVASSVLAEIYSGKDVYQGYKIVE